MDDGFFGAAQGMVDRGDEPRDMNRVLVGIGGLGITAAEVSSPADTTAGQDACVDPRPMVSSGRLVAIQRRRASELSGPHHQSVVEQSSLIEILQKGGIGSVHGREQRVFHV